MEFRLDQDQVELQQTVARLFEDHQPVASIIDREGAPLDRRTWAAAADLGIQGMLAHPDAGGTGLGVTEAVLVFEQVGHHLVTGPLMWSVLAAPLIDGVARGSTVVTGIEVDPADPDRTSPIVEHLRGADVLIALHPDRVEAHPVAGLPEPVALDPLDPVTDVSRVSRLDPGEVVGDAATARRLRLLGTVLAAAELVGVASRALDVARAHALERHQFGVAIGSFQAVKHLLADMYVAVAVAQSATYAAGALADRPGDEDPARSAASAKLLAAEAAVDCTSTAVQVLGGMGFTWDMLPNHLLKRAWHVSHRFGSAAQQSSRIGADLVGAVR